MMIDRDEISAAVKRIRPFVAPTPLVRSDYYSDRLGANVYFKLETMQPTHSFKVRGAFNAILSIPEAQRSRGVVTASGGNHGLGVALAAANQGVPATIYLPIHTPSVKVEAIRKLNADVILYGTVWDEANRHAMQVAQDEGKTYIHPFDNRAVMAGQSTIVSELVDQLNGIDVLVASIGGGGLISGLLSGVKQLTARTRVVGVETVGADCMYQSREAGRIVELPAITSVAESLGAKRTEQTQFEIVRDNIADLVRVTDEAAIRALIDALRETKLLMEPAASCCLAALLSGQVPVQPHETVVVVVCGANVALDQVFKWFAEYR